MVTAGLVYLGRQSGVDAVPMKPVHTGCPRVAGDRRAPDLEFALRLAGLHPSASERRRMCPFRFGPACSPHLAARQAEVRIRLTRITDCFRALAERHDTVIVEGAGGALTPLGQGRTMLDLMVVLGLPVLVVARPWLGTLNHTLLTLGALRRARLTVAGVVLVDTRPGRRGWIETDNQRSIEELAQTRVLSWVPYMPPSAMPVRPLRAHLARALSGAWEMLARSSRSGIRSTK